MKLLLTILFLFGVTATITDVKAETNTVSSTVTGTTTVDKTPSTASAPSVIVNNQDVCSSSAGAAALQTQILGIAGSKITQDLTCERLKLSRALYGMGMKVAAVSVLCQDERVFSAMEMAGTPCPFFGKIGETAQAGWDANPKYKPGYKVENIDVKKYLIGGGVLLAITTGILLL